MTPETPEAAFVLSPVAFWMILSASALLFGLALEQWITYFRLTDSARELHNQATRALLLGDVVAARTACERNPSRVAEIFLAVLNQATKPGLSTVRAAERERQRFQLWLKRRLWTLGTIGALAPFVGLFGTVLGIIRSFRDISANGAGGFTVVAGGVSEALVATAGGILVAVIAVLFFNYFQARGNRVTVEVKLLVDEFVEQVELASGQGLFQKL